MQVCNRNVQQSNGVHDNTSSLSSSTPSSSWKICESAILALSIAKDQVIEQMQEGTLRFDLVAFLNTVILDGILNDPSNYLILYYFLFTYHIIIIITIVAIILKTLILISLVAVCVSVAATLIKFLQN